MNKKLKIIIIYGVSIIFLASIFGTISGTLFSQQTIKEKVISKTDVDRKISRYPIHVAGHLVVNLSAKVINVKIELKWRRPDGAPISDAEVTLNDSVIPALGNGVYKGSITHFVTEEDNNSRNIFIKIVTKHHGVITVSGKIDFFLKLDVSPLYDHRFAVEDTMNINWRIIPSKGRRIPMHLRIINKRNEDVIYEKKEAYEKIVLPPKQFRRKRSLKILANVRHDPFPLTGNAHSDSFVKVLMSTAISVITR
jgi:hypothetical protein